jgi:hypothetical protein
METSLRGELLCELLRSTPSYILYKSYKMRLDRTFWIFIQSIKNPITKNLHLILNLQLIKPKIRPTRGRQFLMTKYFYLGYTIWIIWLSVYLGLKNKYVDDYSSNSDSLLLKRTVFRSFGPIPNRKLFLPMRIPNPEIRSESDVTFTFTYPESDEIYLKRTYTTANLSKGYTVGKKPL